jgi:hypothetical protein
LSALKSNGNLPIHVVEIPRLGSGSICTASTIDVFVEPPTKVVKVRAAELEGGSTYRADESIHVLSHLAKSPGVVVFVELFLGAIVGIAPVLCTTLGCARVGLSACFAVFETPSAEAARAAAARERKAAVKVGECGWAPRALERQNCVNNVLSGVVCLAVALGQLLTAKHFTHNLLLPTGSKKNHITPHHAAK